MLLKLTFTNLRRYDYNILFALWKNVFAEILFLEIFLVYNYLQLGILSWDTFKPPWQFGSARPKDTRYGEIVCKISELFHAFLYHAPYGHFEKIPRHHVFRHKREKKKVGAGLSLPSCVQGRGDVVSFRGCPPYWVFFFLQRSSSPMNAVQTSTISEF